MKGNSSKARMLKLEALVALEALVGKIMVKPEVWPWSLKFTDVYY